MNQVSNAAAVLDRELPGWASKITPETLSLWSSENCVLGQLAKSREAELYAYGAMARNSHVAVEYMHHGMGFSVLYTALYSKLGVAARGAFFPCTLTIDGQMISGESLWQAEIEKRAGSLENQLDQVLAGALPVITDEEVSALVNEWATSAVTRERELVSV